MPLYFFLPIILLVLSVLPAWSEVYKCPDGKGGSILRDVPCSINRPEPGAPLLTPTPRPTPLPDEHQQIIDRGVQAILRLAPPPDYQARIDAAFVRVLKDPDSRKIEYGLPHGAAVCGTINARNSYGGYTGRQVFLSYFTYPDSVELKIYTEDKLRWMRDDKGIEGQLLKACGVFKE